MEVVDLREGFCHCEIHHLLRCILEEVMLLQQVMDGLLGLILYQQP
jgi:hypothetical protein